MCTYDVVQTQSYRHVAMIRNGVYPRVIKSGHSSLENHLSKTLDLGMFLGSRHFLTHPYSYHSHIINHQQLFSESGVVSELGKVHYSVGVSSHGTGHLKAISYSGTSSDDVGGCF